MNRYHVFWMLAALATGVLCATMSSVEGGDFRCYRGSSTVTTHYATYASSPPAHTYATPSYGYGHQYLYYKQYVPYAVEVQVNKDRYYSLSDLYRDRLYLEAFDLMKEMRAKLSETKSIPTAPVQPTNPVPPAMPKVQDAGYQPSLPAPQVGPAPPSSPWSLGKTGDKARAILNDKCYTCHNKDTAATDKRPEPLRLENPDAVPMYLRWAGFGMAAVRQMPKHPSRLKDQKEIDSWKITNGLTDQQLQDLHDGWLK